MVVSLGKFYVFQGVLYWYGLRGYFKHLSQQSIIYIAYIHTPIFEQIMLSEIFASFILEFVREALMQSLRLYHSFGSAIESGALGHLVRPPTQ